MNIPATKFLLGLCLAFSICSTAQNTSDNSLSYPADKLDNHKILLSAVNATELGTLLEKSGPFTIFAPSDAAFAKFSNN